MFIIWFESLSILENWFEDAVVVVIAVDDSVNVLIIVVFVSVLSVVWLVSAKLDTVELISEDKAVLVLESISVSRAEVDFDVTVVLISLVKVVLVLEIKFVIERPVDIDVSKAGVKFSIEVVSNVLSGVWVEFE